MKPERTVSAITITETRAWVTAVTLFDRATAIVRPTDYAITKLRIATPTDAICEDTFCIEINGKKQLTIPIIALANGEWFDLPVRMQIGKNDTVRVIVHMITAIMPFTLALAGLERTQYIANEEP